VIQKPVFYRACSSHEIVDGKKTTPRSNVLKAFVAGLFILLFVPLSGVAQEKLSDANPLAMPALGSYGLRILSPNILELTLITTKTSYDAPVNAWNFVDNNFNATLPAPSQFTVTVGSQSIGVQQVGFKRRPLYAPEKRDLRIASQIYLVLAGSIAEGQSVEVKNPGGNLWGNEMQFTSVMDGKRYSPAIHVNQGGYMPEYAKKAMVGFYLGSLGEMSISAQSFQLVDAKTGAVAFQGALTQHADVGFSYTPTPYQSVFQADFSSFQTAGEYRMVVPGLGASFPFRIDNGTTAKFARTFAMGLYHQRCGTDNTLPFTRHTHDVCHTGDAQVPELTDEFKMASEVIAEVSKDYKDNPRHTAPQLKDVNSSLYPFVNRGRVNVSGGHHDAGDYSKYTINSAGLVHYLVFAADSFPGVASLDNIGIPESGDGKSDMLQEAKWEADFLAKMQDADGGFYFLVYPKNRRYENNVLPENGDPQVVWPKTTAVTAAAVGALAEAGSSPLMKQQFPAEAALYLEKAKKGWEFLMNAINKYGKDGSYQKITHYGNEFMHDDELAWAAAALYAATGESQYQSKLFEFYPDPNDPNTSRWSWWRLFEGYGCAARTYAFAARSGRLPASKLDPNYLAKCEKEILTAGDDQARWSRQSAYGTSLPDTTKQYRSPGWYFSSERAFDVTVAYQILPKQEYIDAIVSNCNYEGGSNPLNMPFVTGIGSKRQQEVVSQYAWNDRRILPPAGLPQGNVRQGYGYLESYRVPSAYYDNGVLKTNWINELPFLSFPGDNLSNGPYPYYDRWTDMIDTMCEFVVTDMARSYASLSFWMAQGPAKTQSWRPVAGQITGIDDNILAGKTNLLTLTAPEVDLSTAQVLWEVRYLQPTSGNPGGIIPQFSGEHWIEAEALLPDGRRVVAASNFVAGVSLNIPPNADQSSALPVTSDIAALYHLDTDTADLGGKQQPIALQGNTHLDSHNLAWMSQRGGAALRFLDLGDTASVQIPVSTLTDGATTTAIVLDAMIYVNEFKAFDRDVATILSLNQTWNSYMEFGEDKYGGPYIKAGASVQIMDANLKSLLTTKTWHHLSLAITSSGYFFKLDGKAFATIPSNDLANWNPTQTATLLLGDFDGWLDEIAIHTFRNNAPSLPSVTLNTPLMGGTYLHPAAVSLNATATGNGSPIRKIEFYSGSTKIGDAFDDVDTAMWYPIAPGTYTIVAKATDAANRVGVSAPRIITVKPAASTAILTPLSVSSAGFRLRVTGQTGVHYKIQASRDSKEWVEIGNVTLEGTTAEFVDASPGADHKLYRAVAVF
jgi:hypothetical protein